MISAAERCPSEIAQALTIAYALNRAPRLSYGARFRIASVETARAFDQGCEARTNGEHGLVILNFASPRDYDDNRNHICGTRLLSIPQTRLPWLTDSIDQPAASQS